MGKGNEEARRGQEEDVPMKSYGIDPVDRCAPPICYEEHSITLDCGHGRNGGGVLIYKSSNHKQEKENDKDANSNRAVSEAV